MKNYAFSESLSPIDFELLSKDLLEADLGVKFETFREGRDKGIDLRHSPQVGKTGTIVQCKRYGENQLSNLKSSLKRSELPKIRKLDPDRYILTTSVGLTVGQVDELVDLLSPYVKSSGDIYGRDRLNSILSNHSEIEKSHIKLWIGSTGVIDSILNAGTHAVSRDELERTIRAARLYVKNPSFEQALKIIKEYRVCIISGQPGIGKTTLARMLLLYFHELDFEVVKIESDVSEARKSFHHKKSKFILYDDFLGQTALADKLNKNEDQKLLAFMATVRESKDLVFVLTTREYILNQAKLVYEKLSRERFNHRTCIIDLGTYSRRIRAQILYNHLFFSEMDPAFASALIDRRGYLEIIDHENYNPRLIEFLTDSEWLIGVTAPDYPDFFLSNLDNPEKIWDHAFRRQISDEGRSLLFVLTTLPTQVLLTDLRVAFKAWEGSGHRAEADFINALKELDGTFTKTDKVRDSILVSFSTPSIRDYTQNLLIGGECLEEALESIAFFEQALWFGGILVDEDWVGRRTALERHSDVILSALVSSFGSAGCLVTLEGTPEWRRVKDVSIAPPGRLIQVADLCRKLGSSDHDGWQKSMMGKIASAVETQVISVAIVARALARLREFELLGSRGGERLIEAMKSRLLTEATDLEDFEVLAEFVDVCKDSLSDEELEKIEEALGQFVDDYVADEDDAASPDSLREIASRFSNLGETLGVDTAFREEQLREEADQVEADDPPDWDPEYDGSRTTGDSCSDREVDSMFSTLGD